MFYVDFKNFIKIKNFRDNFFIIPRGHTKQFVSDINIYKYTYIHRKAKNLDRRCDE